MSNNEMILRVMLLTIGAAFVGAAAFIKHRKPEIEVFPVFLLLAGMACIVTATDGSK